MLEWQFVVHSWIFEVHSNNSDWILSAFQIFCPICLLFGGKPPNVPTIFFLYLSFICTSERLRNICIFRSQNTSVCIYKKWYGTLNDSMTDKTLTLRKIYEYASDSRNFVCTNDILAGSHVPTHFQMYRQKYISEKALGGGGGMGQFAPISAPPPPLGFASETDIYIKDYRCIQIKDAIF